MARIFVIMRLTRYLLRYGGTEVPTFSLQGYSASDGTHAKKHLETNVANGTLRPWLYGLVG